MKGLLRKAVAKRASGDKPSPPVAAMAAMVAGAAVALLTYRVLRS